MNEEQIEKLLAGLETDRVEFKEALKATDPQEERKHILRTVSAFYNTKGGTMIFGVHDKTAEPVGLTDPQGTEHGFAQQVAACLDLDIQPKSEIVPYKGVNLLLVTCPKGPRPPYVIKGQPHPYIRVGSRNIEATPDQEALLLRERSTDPQDRYPVTTATLDDLDVRAAEEYLRATSSHKTFPDIQRVLLAEGILVRDADGQLIPTLAGMLLFGKVPQQFLPHAVIKADVKMTDEQEGWDDIQTLSGNLFEQVKSAEAFVKRHIPVSATIVGFRRVEVPAVPLEALREAIVNALVHRDYHETGSEMHIRIRSGAITVINPGRVVTPLTIEIVLQGNFTPTTRNGTIANALVRLGNYMDKRGTGVERMRSLMKKANLPEPTFDEDSNSFRVIFSAPVTRARLSPTVHPQISDEEITRLALDAADLRILEIVQERSEIRTREIMLALEKSRVTAVAKLNELVEKEVLERTVESRQDPNLAYRLHKRFSSPSTSTEPGHQALLGL